MASACAHPVIYHGLCAACGQDVSAVPASSSASGGKGGGGGGSHAIVLGGAHKTIHLSSAALVERTRTNTIDLLSNRRMICVLDLDHTLLHATSDPRVAGYLGKEAQLFSFVLAAPNGSQRTHYVKLRPGLQTFLDEVAKLFDLHVYTMGARNYADAVVPIVDPTHRFIKHRIVSRDESTAPGSSTNPAHVAKSLKRMYPCDEGLICIVDDRTDVWAGNAKNVARAFEYLFFSGRGEMNSRPGEQQTTEASLPIFPYQFSTHPFPDNVLLSLISVLQATHSLFYRQIDQATQPPPGSSTPAAPASDLIPLSVQLSIPRLLTFIKRTTLADCVIVFSGVFPVVKPKDGAPMVGGSGAQKAEAWIQATAFGAICLEDFPENDTTGKGDYPVLPFGVDALAPPRVTHVVAARDGSAKLRYAATMPTESRPLLVHVSWLWHSIAHFQRGEETLFPLWSEKEKSARATPSPQPRVASTPAIIDLSGDEPTTPTSSAASASAPAAAAAAAASTAAIAASSSAAVVAPVAAAAASNVIPSLSSATPAATSATVGGIRRRIPKKVAAVTMAQSTAPPPHLHNEATPASAASSPLPPATSTPASAAASAATADGVSSDPPRHSLHLIHHVRKPITPEALVARVQAHISNLESAQLARDALSDITIAREQVLAQQLTASQRRNSGSGPSSASANPKRKSVTFSARELGPTNPAYDRDTHTMPDAAMAATSMDTSGPSAALKRKAHVPLDDIDRLRRGVKPPSARPSAFADDEMDVEHMDVDDVLDLAHSADDIDASAGAGDLDERDAFDIFSEDAFNDNNEMSEYGDDAGQFDDDN